MVILCPCSGSPANGVLSHTHSHLQHSSPHHTITPVSSCTSAYHSPDSPLNLFPTNPSPPPSLPLHPSPPSFTHPLPSPPSSPPPPPPNSTHIHTCKTCPHKHTHTNPQLTELLQKVLINFMKEQFADRLVTIKPNFSVLNMSGKEGTVPFTDVHVAI